MPQPTPAAKVWPSLLNKEDQCSLFHHKRHRIWSWWSFLLLRLLLPLIQRDVAGTSYPGRSWAGCVLLSHLQAGEPTLPHGATQGRKEGAMFASYKQPEHAGFFIQLSLYLAPQWLDLKSLRFKHISSSGGCSVKQALATRPNILLVLAIMSQHRQKTRCLKKEKDTNWNSFSLVGFAVHWALPRRAAVHWSSHLNCLDSYKEPNKLSWLQLHEPAAKRNAEQTRRGICSFSLCRTGFKLPIFQFVFGRVGSLQPLQICWKAFQQSTG